MSEYRTVQAPAAEAAARQPARTPVPAAEHQARAVADASARGPVRWSPVAPPVATERTNLPDGGESLGADTRGEMENRLGFDLGAVRIHRDPVAERKTEERDANAVTVGRDIYFGRGQFAPHTADGRKLLAHELAHTVQQGRSGLLGPQHEDNEKKKKKAAAAERDRISKMTDEEKSLLRKDLNDEAQAEADKQLAEIAALPSLDQLPAEKKDEVKALRAAIAAARPGAEKVAAGGDPLRVEVLDALDALTTDKVFVVLFLSSPGVIDFDSLTALGDAATPATDEMQKLWQRDRDIFRRGGEGVLRFRVLFQTYSEHGIDDPKLLKTAEQNESEAAGDGGSGGESGGESGGGKPGLTTEDRARLRGLYDAVPESEGERAVVDEAALAEQLRDLSPEELQQLEQYLRESKPPEEGTAEAFEDLVARFKALTPAERDALLINQEMNRDNPSAPKLGGKVLLDMSKATESDAKVMEHARTLDSNFEQVANLLNDPEKMKGHHPISIDLGLFTRELAFFRGLLAGGAARSKLVEGAVTDLTLQLALAQEEVIQEMEAETLVAGSLMLATALSEGAAAPLTAAKIADALAKLERLREKMEKIRKAWAVFEQVKSFLALVEAVPAAVEEFRAFWDRAAAMYQQYRPLLEDVEKLPDDIDAQMAALEDGLIEKFDELVAGEFGKVLEMMYIDPETPPAELLNIIMELPLGLDALVAAKEFYLSADPEAPDTAERVMIKAAKAGMLMYPLVGFLAAFAAKQVGEAFPDQSFSEHIIGALARYQKDNTKRGEENRSTFFRLNRSNYDYNEADLNPYLEKGAARLQELAAADEPGQHWTTGWLRLSLREELHELNNEFSHHKVTATVKEKKKGKPAKGATPATTKREEVPLPPFRLKFSHFDGSSKSETVELSLNPAKKVTFDSLSYDDFKKPEGVPFSLAGKKKREKAVRAWLDDRDYQIIDDNNGNPHLRLKDGTTDAGGRVYIHIDDTVTPAVMREGIRKDDYKNFLGREIHDSIDLPEGYFLSTGSSGAVVSRKRGARLEGLVPELGLDTDGKLTEGRSAALPPKDLTPTAVTNPVKEPVDFESYDWEAAIQDTVKLSSYNAQGANEAGWRRRAATNDQIKKRPTQVEGDLGYVLRARAFGDKLGSAHLPQLKTDDDKGHLIAKRFGGTDQVNNLVPMKRTLNQFPGKWYGLESDIAKTYVGKTATPGHYAWASIKLDYPSSTTRRPNRFRVEWKEKDAKSAVVSGKGTRGKVSMSND